jgi:integrase
VKKGRFPTKGRPVVVTVGAFSARVYWTPSKGYDGFTLSWIDPAQGRRRETFAAFAEAKRRAEQVATALVNGDTTAAGFSGTDRARFAAVVETLRPTGVTAEIAAAQFAEAHAILGGRSIIDAAREFASRHRLDLPAVAVADAVAAFIADRVKAGASTRYVGDLRSRLLHGFAASNAVNLGDVTPNRIRAWLEAEPGSPRNHNNNFAAVRSLIRFCVARRWLARDCDLLEGISKRKSAGGTIEIWTPAEMAALLAHCPEAAIPALAISAFSGMRNAEVLRLDWSEVHFADGHIVVPALKAKTASRRLAPCPPNLAQWLTPRAKTSGPIWGQNETRLHDAYRAAAKGAGLEWRDNALRHSFISYRVAAVEDVAKVALEAGNSPQMIFANYRALVKPAQAAAWFAVAPSAPGNVTPMPKPEAAPADRISSHPVRGGKARP